jgi:hypothetical protein
MNDGYTSARLKGNLHLFFETTPFCCIEINLLELTRVTMASSWTLPPEIRFEVERHFYAVTHINLYLSS